MTSTVDGFMPYSFDKGKLNTGKEIADFPSTFVVSEELVKIYLDHSRHLHFSKDFRSQATVEAMKLRTRITIGKSHYYLEG